MKKESMENTKTQATITYNTPLQIDIVEEQAPVTMAGKPLQEFSSQQLLDALYWIWDAFERSNVPFFLVFQTAEDAIKQHDLTGDRVEIGVRRMEWVSGGKRIIDAFVMPLSEGKDEAIYEYRGVPVIVHVYDDSDCVVQTDMVRYRYEEFKIPNPYSKFKELYGR